MLRVILARMTMLAGPSTSVAVLGAGTVGGALLERLAGEPGLSLSSVLVRDVQRRRPYVLPDGVLTADADRALGDAEVVVELMGGTGLAVDLMLRALEDGRRVVTGNKAALAEHWEKFLPFLQEGRLYFEAAVMAGTPAVAPLTGVLRGSEPLQLDAILNGTCSFMIGRLEQGSDFAAALAEAQALGYAEADPTLDIGGFDAAHKLNILGRLAFDPDMSWDTVRAGTRGISELTPAIVKEAMEDGGSVALLASIVPGASGWEPHVRPVYLPAGHRLGQLGAEFNGLLFEGAQCGQVLIGGPGAGGAQTASAVFADVLDAASGRPGPAPLTAARPLPVNWRPQPLGELRRA